MLYKLILRSKQLAALPLPQVKFCRGRLFAPADYRVDVMEWGFADVVGPATTEPVQSKA